MARDTRVRNQQVGANLNLQPVALQQGNRGFQIGVSDRNVRAAQALQSAFGVGVQAATAIQTDRNATGRQEAIIERASGAQGPDADNKQAGYLRAWDELDANFDFSAAKAELPEMLRGANWEELGEEEVVGTINEYMESQFGGLDPASAYAETMAPKLLELQDALVTDHRSMQVAKIQEEQRTKIFANAEAALAENPEAGVNYTDLFGQTGTFFDGSAKKEVFWDTLFELAVSTGDPSIIENVPAMMNGVPTGSKDPAFAQQRNAAINSAASVATKKAKDMDAAAKATAEGELFNAQLAIVDAVAQGQDPELLIESIRNNPEASFADITAAVNFGRSTLDENESQSPNLPGMDALWVGIYDGKATITDVLNAKTDGILGTGPQATQQFQTMLATAQRMQDAKKSGGDSGAVGAFRSELTSRFNPQMAGPMAAIDPTMMHIRNNAISMYNDLVLTQGMDPAEANIQVRETFEPQADKVGLAGGAREATVSAALTPDVIKSVVTTGNLTSLAGFSPRDISTSVLEAVDGGKLTEAEANELLLLLQ